MFQLCVELSNTSKHDSSGIWTAWKYTSYQGIVFNSYIIRYKL